MSRLQRIKAIASRKASSILGRLIDAVLILLVCIAINSCHEIDDDRIPSYPVSINLGEAAMWHTYGVSGYGIHRQFIKQLREPAGFPYLERSFTGFGGVLLIGGMDPFSTQTNIPLAYDLACPVERKQDVRVKIDPSTYEAICPVCGSVYDITMSGGSPISGPAYKDRYGLRRYKCLPGNGGYLITN